MRRVTRLASFSAVLVLLAVAAAPGLTAPPDMGGDLGVELTVDKNGPRGVAKLSLSFDVGESGSHRARISFGSIASSASEVELGSSNRLWNVSTEITQAYLEHTGAYTERGQRVVTRLGDFPLTLSRNVARIPMFQGIWVRDITWAGFGIELAHGWNPKTSSSERDTVQLGRILRSGQNSEISLVVLRSEHMEYPLAELSLRYSFGPFEVDTLFLDDGVFNAYRIAASAPVRSWKVTGALADWGPFDTPYTDHDEGYYWEKYNGWYNIRELGLSGGVGQVAVKLDYLRYDDLINIQKKVKTEAAVPLGSSTVFRHKLDFDQGAKKLISNELILEGTASLPGLLRNVGWSVLWDTVAKTDSLVVSASYTAPNRITFELEHKKDSGAKLTISSQMTF